MSWRETLKPGTFRGVPYLFDASEASFGRRIVTHEVPLADQPINEDLGRGPRRWRMKLFVLGDDYLDKRDALIAAIETEGPGHLVHPTFGKVRVSVDGEFRVIESAEHGGSATFEVAFVLSEPPPATAINTRGVVTAITASARKKAIESMAAGSVQLEEGLAHAGLGLAAEYLLWVNQLHTSIMSVLGLALDFADEIGDGATDLARVLNDGGEMGASLMSIGALFAHIIEAEHYSLTHGTPFDLSVANDESLSVSSTPAPLSTTSATLLSTSPGSAGVPGTIAVAPLVPAPDGRDVTTVGPAGGPLPADPRLPVAIRLLVTIGNDFGLLPSLNVKTGLYLTPDVLAETADLDLFAATLHVGMLLAAVDAACAIDYASADDADSMRQFLADAFDAAEEEITDDTLYTALEGARVAMENHLQTIAVEPLRTVSYVPARTLPALVIAHQLYGDATRETELLQGNPAIRNPVFVSGGQPLRVLNG